MREPNETFDPLEALSVREAAALLHVSEPTIRRHIKDGELPSLTMGRCRRIRRVDLEAFLDRRAACDWQTHRPQVSRAIEPTVADDYAGDGIPF